MKPYDAAATAAVVAASVGGAGLVALKRAFPYLPYDLKFVSTMVKMRKRFNVMTLTPVIDHWENLMATRPHDVFLIFEDKCYTYQFVDQMACKVANIALGWGLKPSDNVAIMIENEPAFVWTFFGLQKLGIPVAWINHHLRSHALVHCVTIVKPKALIVGQGEALLEAVTSVFDELAPIPVYAQGLGLKSPPVGVQSFDTLMMSSAPAHIHRNVRSHLTPDTACCYIYTSGTTGYPKAVPLDQKKVVRSGGMMYTAGLTEKDTLYTVVPLYHTSGGALGVVGAVCSGATLVLRRKFSASHFWTDCYKYDVTAIQYIGELFRYLLAQKPRPEERTHKVRVAVGNGLRMDIWEKVVSRFKVNTILEFYGATEGFGSNINTFNRPGAIGRISPFLQRIMPITMFLVNFDYATATPLRNKAGKCMNVPIGEPGLILAKIPPEVIKDGTVTVYEGSKENEKKLVRNAFQDGDLFFNTGDVAVQDKDCFIYFHDRIGDTFRWKGENVSTTEVANALCQFPAIHDANVYGVTVPGHDGRAGMAAITVNAGHTLGEEELKQLYDHVLEELPSYARPRFLRLLQEADLTGNFKQRKIALIKEGYDLSVLKDPLYYLNMEAKTYSPLTSDALGRFLKSRL